MRFSLPLLLLLPLHAAFAQMRPTYSAPRPSYSPPAYRPTTPSNYQVQQQNQAQAHQTFQRMQAQQTQQAQQYFHNQFYNQQRAITRQQQQLAMRHPLSPAQRVQTQAQQQQAEQKAAEQLAQLSQQQQRRRQEHPAADAQQAAAQQLADNKELTVLTVKTYREVYLPGQLLSTLQSLALPFEDQQEVQALTYNLRSSAWWHTEPAQAPAKVAAYGTTLAKLTTKLLGFDLASPPPAPAPLAANSLSEMLAKDTFDQQAAAQLLQSAAQAEKQLAGAQLAQAVQAFHDLSQQLAASQGPQDLKQQRKDVQKSLRRVRQELARYQAHVGNSGSLAQAQKEILKSTAGYLAKNGS